jgi:hypothetical protein
LSVDYIRTIFDEFCSSVRIFLLLKVIMDYDEIDDNDMSEAGVHGSSSKKPDNK